jgi:hypothetical protein
MLADPRGRAADRLHFSVIKSSGFVIRRIGY